MKRTGGFGTTNKNILQTTAKTTDQAIENVKKYARNFFFSRQFRNSERQDELDGLTPVILFGIIGALAFFGKSNKIRNYKGTGVRGLRILLLRK